MYSLGHCHCGDHPAGSLKERTLRELGVWECVHMCVWIFVCLKLTGQVSVSTAGLPALLDPPLSHPRAQWLTGATYGMDFPAHICLENTRQTNKTGVYITNACTLHFSLLVYHSCPSLSVQSGTQQSSWRWIWRSVQEHTLLPGRGSDAIAGRTQRYMYLNNITE